ncbi:MAG TPA: UDP-N-acetylmuramate dehydrogenase [Micromonosporaceae bacterium]|nr:UDP-N-acetylmuramate dehydrogenase [Micromonosporaceae bacterium]
MPDVSAETAAGSRAEPAVRLADYTTLRLGGPAPRVFRASSAEDMVRIAREAYAPGGPVLVLAGGSNVVIGDGGFPGTVLLVRSTGLAERRDGASVLLSVQAGEEWDDVVAATVAAGWSGLECLSGIPGSAGATPIQNVGAYGQEVAETIESVRVYDRVTGEVLVLPPAACGFAYRTSVFKHSDRALVLSVDFRLQVSSQSTPVRYAELARALDVPLGGTAPLADVRAAVLALRAGKGMVLDERDPDTYSVGSFFTNPVLDALAYAVLRDRTGSGGGPPSWPAPGSGVKVSAAWLIEHAGFTKGYGHSNGVGISTKHTLALTNRGGGTTAALLELAREIRDGVRDRFGVWLHPEPVLVNCEL